ncbi:MAG: M24 family metallopeptidase [Rhizobiales bacterium]|nr:M24 family metallopeptidase [Hyphomicrobiales bacterium]
MTANLIADRLRALLSARGLDAIIAYGGVNFGFLTGFQNYFDNPAASMAVLPADAAKGDFVIVANWVADAARDATQVDDIVTFPLWLEIADIEEIRAGRGERRAKPVRYDVEGNIRLLARHLADRGLAKGGRIAIELNLVSAQVYRMLTTHCPDVEWIDAADLFFELRRLKTPEQVEMLREATRFAEDGLTAVVSTPMLGRDVASLRLIYERACNERAAANPGCGFLGSRVTASVGGVISPTVMGGPRVARGDLVFFDCGASIRGYGSDTGRTIALDEPTRESRAIMDALRRGMDAAFALVKPGARMCDIFHAGQDAVRAAGLDWYTRGHIGHAMGLGMGEMPPFLSPKEERPLEPGMVMALETPLYVRGLGGFQIEECFLVTDSGYDLLTTLPRDFLRGAA